MDKNNGKLTLQEKTEFSNKNIKLYRETGNIKYKELAFDIVKPDVENFCYRKFYNYRQYIDDIIQNAFLLINKYMNGGSAFDPDKGVYILVYLQEAIVDNCRTTIDKYKTPWKYDIKKRRELIKNLQAIIDEQNLSSYKEAVAIYIDKEYPDLSVEERRNIESAMNKIINITQSSQIPDDKEQDEDTIHYELVDEKSDFTKSLDVLYEIRYIYHIALMLYEKGKLSNLQLKTFSVYIKSKLQETDEKKSDLARKLGMTRQNFCRALNDALEIVLGYKLSHSDDDRI